MELPGNCLPSLKITFQLLLSLLPPLPPPPPLLSTFLLLEIYFFIHYTLITIPQQLKIPLTANSIQVNALENK